MTPPAEFAPTSEQARDDVAADVLALVSLADDVIYELAYLPKHGSKSRQLAAMKYAAAGREAFLMLAAMFPRRTPAGKPVTLAREGDD